MDKLEKFFEEHPEFREPASKLVYELMPFIIESLILSNKIDRTRTDDPKYIWAVIIENLDVVDLIRHGARIDFQIMEVARESATKERISVVVILVATAIEHIVNLFYRGVLEKRFGLSSEEATEAIRSNFQTKLGWLLQVVAESKLSDELYKRVKQITDLRNAFVHYKAVGVSLNDRDKAEVLVNQAKAIGIDNILNTPNDLENELFSRYESMFPERELAIKLTEMIMPMEPTDES